MDLQTDPKVVARLAEEREEENWRFRSYLKGCDLDAEELDAIVHRHYKAVAAQIDCCACANCCREALPILRQSDVARLATGMGLPDAEVVDRFLVPDDEEGTLAFKDTPCPLLADKRCTVYEHRPDDCRSYPHLHKDEFVFRLSGVIDNCSVCPIVFNVFERLKEELWEPEEDDWEDDWG